MYSRTDLRSLPQTRVDSGDVWVSIGQLRVEHRLLCFGRRVLLVSIFVAFLVALFVKMRSLCPFFLRDMLFNVLFNLLIFWNLLLPNFIVKLGGEFERVLSKEVERLRSQRSLGDLLGLLILKWLVFASNLLALFQVFLHYIILIGSVTAHEALDGWEERELSREVRTDLRRLDQPILWQRRELVFGIILGVQLSLHRHQQSLDS